MMFGQQPVGLTSQPIAPGPGVQSPNIPQIKKGGMFGSQMDWGTAIAAALAGWTASSNPGPQQALLASFAQRRKDQMEESQYQRERQDKQTDWQDEYDYKLAHPTQGDDEYTRALIASGVQPGTPEFAQHMGTRRDLLENPPQYMNVPGVGLVQIPRGPTQAQPTAPVGKLTPLGAGGPASGPGGFQY